MIAIYFRFDFDFWLCTIEVLVKQERVHNYLRATNLYSLYNLASNYNITGYYSDFELKF